MKLKTKDSTILITGASSGMGNEIAKQSKTLQAQVTDTTM